MTGSCLQCGAPLGEGARFCSACGAPVAVPEPVGEHPAEHWDEHAPEPGDQPIVDPAAGAWDGPFDEHVPDRWDAAPVDALPAPQPPPGMQGDTASTHAYEADPLTAGPPTADPLAAGAYGAPAPPAPAVPAHPPVETDGTDAAGQGLTRAEALAQQRGDDGPLAALWRGAWSPAVVAGLVPLAVLALLAVPAALGIAGDDAGLGMVWQLGAALVGATFGGDVTVGASWERGGSLLDRLADDVAWSFGVEGMPLTLTLVGVVVLAIVFAWRTRRLPATDLVGTALRTALVAGAGVGLVTLLGRMGHTDAGFGDGMIDGGGLDDVRVDIHASTIGSVVGAVLITLVTTGAIALARRGAPESVARARAALAAPAWVLGLAFVALQAIGVAVLLVAAVLREGAPSSDEVTWAILALPAVTVWALGVGLGPGVDVEMSRLTNLPGLLGGGGADGPTREVGVHLPAVADESALAWLIPPAVLVVILIAGLLVVTRYDDAKQARVGSLVAGGLALVGTTLWAGLSGLTIAADDDSWLAVSLPSLVLGLWVGVLVAAAGFLATALLPRLPHGVLRVLAVIARR